MKIDVVEKNQVRFIQSFFEQVNHNHNNMESLRGKITHPFDRKQYYSWLGMTSRTRAKDKAEVVCKLQFFLSKQSSLMLASHWRFLVENTCRVESNR